MEDKKILTEKNEKERNGRELPSKRVSFFSSRS